MFQPIESEPSQAQRVEAGTLYLIQTLVAGEWRTVGNRTTLSDAEATATAWSATGATHRVLGNTAQGTPCSAPTPLKGDIEKCGSLCVDALVIEQDEFRRGNLLEAARFADRAEHYSNAAFALAAACGHQAAQP